MRFLVTRPQPDCKRSADKLRAAGHIADEAPLLEFKVMPPEPLDLSGVSALAFSSRRAVSVLRGHPQLADLLGLPVFTVGDATAEACRQVGFQDVRSAGGDFAALGALILREHAGLGPGAVFYPAAQDRAGDLEALLKDGGLACRTRVVYRMEPVEKLPAAVVTALTRAAYDGVLVYSRRTAETLLFLLKSSGLDAVVPGLKVYAISSQAGEPLSDIMRVRVADAPCEAALLDLVLAEC
ncbi:uroporphyrinogen-III synthase [Roseibium marinum]|uniref:Uroporphyrinogen-III synthase n=1 Tax=Roseibium marinum TaxID=281252 RepID=A0A2S3URW4_9HYPH|nr:uroporphyrinogen-III synthase [Roseibium marinum]POF30461.1 uroporphyrinogen-III synthase [Roseibium marinum]